MPLKAPHAAGFAQKLRAAGGILRSLRVYYGSRGRLNRMTALYAQFVKPGDLAFDIGAHVGDRTAAFLRLGARVVAVEPQPAAFACLRLIYGRNRRVTLLPAAISDAPGMLTLMVNTRNPTVSTAAASFPAAADGAPGWEGQVWDREMRVKALSLDELIEIHGKPAFVKIDIEGFEDKALYGLSQPLQALSFEFTTIQRDVAHRCLARLAALGPYRFNAALGESQSLIFAEPVTAGEIAAWLDALPASANSGDVYAKF